MRKKKNVKQERQISHKKICKSNNNEYISHNKDKYVKCLYPDVKIENSHKNNQVPIIPIIDLTFNIEPNIIDLENEIDPRVIDLDFLSYPLYNFENYSKWFELFTTEDNKLFSADEKKKALESFT